MKKEKKTKTHLGGGIGACLRWEFLGTAGAGLTGLPELRFELTDPERLKSFLWFWVFFWFLLINYFYFFFVYLSLYHTLIVLTDVKKLLNQLWMDFFLIPNLNLLHHPFINFKLILIIC